MRAGFRRASQGRIWLALIVLWAAAVPAFAQTDSDINGKRTSHGFAVSDGDTVKFGRQLISLFGIDAPEKLQPCDDGKWFPGPLATKALIAFIAGRPVSCRQVDYDRKNNRGGVTSGERVQDRNNTPRASSSWAMSASGQHT